MNLFKFFALIAVPFTVMSMPLAAQAASDDQARSGADSKMKKTVLASNKKDGEKGDKEKDGKDDEKDGKDKPDM